MRTRIEQALAELAREHNVSVLFACESGSRGWGFASPDSDYDVRFIYVNRLPWYLTVDPGRDVIELPVDETLDISGWDLRKALGLLKRGNATVMEWLRSPVVYHADPDFAAAMVAASELAYRPERSFHHYAHMAKRNYSSALQGDRVKLKKYLYVLRPLLAALWVERGLGAPPMRFAELVAGIVTDTATLAEIDDLLAVKRQSGEAAWGTPFPCTQALIDRELDRVFAVAIPPSPPAGSGALDALLHNTVLRFT